MEMLDKKSVKSFKDVQISYLMEGLPAIENMYKEGLASKTTLRKALKKLQESGQDVKSLEEWVIEQFGASVRGRSSPMSGETRTYRAQQVTGSGPFLRLPLEVLDIKKGELVRVRFGENDITVTRK